MDVVNKIFRTCTYMSIIVLIIIGILSIVMAITDIDVFGFKVVHHDEIKEATYTEEPNLMEKEEEEEIDNPDLVEKVEAEEIESV